ncbi:MAG: hypothetical protein OEU92_07840 [Alphaproteobacteria bacterium]|nr:hypothetical protein [Alphaproteobacteria bacterium]
MLSVILVTIGLLVCHPPSALAKDISISVYGGWLTSNDWVEVFAPMRWDFVDSQMMALAVSRQAGWLSETARTEVEGQIVRHVGIQDHWEFNVLGVIRRTALPWDALLDMSVAGGLGLSYATEPPKAEIDFEGETERLLAYWMLELDAAVPRTKALSVLARLHHRSSAYGLFGDAGGVNVLALGIRYRF